MENSESEEEREEELDPEQMDKLLQFQGLSGLEDLEVCRALLESKAWDLEATAREHLGMEQEPPREQEQPPPAPPPAPPAIRAGAQAVWRRPQGPLQWVLYLFSLPASILYGGAGALWAFVTSLIGLPPRPTSQVRDPVGDVSSFVSDYESRYGEVHPVFHRGSYQQALEVAKKELKFLLVYLHSEDHQDTDSFCSSVLASPEVITYVSENFLFWGCSVRRPEGHRVSLALRESSYPALCVIVLRQSRMVVVGRQEGSIDSQRLVTWLQQTVTEYEAFIVAARAERDERDLDREIRSEQEQAFQETLRRDQEREQRRAEEDARRAQEAEQEAREQEEQKLAKKQEQDKKQEIQRQKMELVSEIPEEPAQGEEEAVRVLIKLPGGQRLERRFLLSHSLKHIFYFVFCHPDSPDEFEIVSNYPKRRLSCQPQPAMPEPPSLKESGFGKSEMLFVYDLNS